MTQSAVLIIRIIRHTDQLVYTGDVSINISLELLNSMYSLQLFELRETIISMFNL